MPGSYYEVRLVAAAPTELAAWQCCPPLPPPSPVVSLNSPILSPQNVGATLMSGLRRCPDKLSVSAERFGRCPNIAMGGRGINCNYGDNQNRRAGRPSGTRSLSPPFCLSQIIETLSVKDTHADGAEPLGSKLSRLSADKNTHPPALPLAFSSAKRTV